MKYLYNPPLLFKKLWGKSRWHSSVNKILITFDDGPLINNTEAILKKLDHHKIKSLFFCVGNNFRNNPLLVSEIIAQGHTIGNHTMNHKILSRASTEEMSLEIIRFNQLAEDQFNYKVKYFRPPHGRYSFRLAEFIDQQKLMNVMWSTLTYDYRNDLGRVIKSFDYLRPDSIVVFHDSMKSKNIILYSIDLLVEEIRRKDYLNGTPEECLS